MVLVCCLVVAAFEMIRLSEQVYIKSKSLVSVEMRFDTPPRLRLIMNNTYLSSSCSSISMISIMV